VSKRSNALRRSKPHGLWTSFALLTVAWLAWFVVFVAPTGAGVPPSSDSTTTTEQSTTTTTQATTTTTVTSTTQPRPSTTSTTVPRSSTSSASTVSTTTTAAPPTSAEQEAPEIVSDDTLPSRTTGGTDDGGLSTDAKLAFVVGGLVAVGVLIGLLTFLYWRHTRPQRYMDALDALADVEQKVPRSPDEVPTAEQAAIPAGIATGAAGATTAVRIIEADEPGSPGDSGQDHEASDEAVSLDEPTTITTVEDLETNAAVDDDKRG
jgi:hypothetical protein